jgi:hypothetical protein
MADTLDRTVTITLRAANDAYVQSIAAAATATNAALASMNNATAGADKSVQALNQSVAATGAATTAAASNTQILAAAIEETSKNMTANAAAAAASATGTQQLTTAAAASATAQANAATATEKTTEALASQAKASTDAAAKVKETGAAVSEAGGKASEAAGNIEKAGEKTSAVSEFFKGLKEEAVKLVPGLDDVLKIATGVATGMEGLEIAKQVGEWLLDVGEKALTSSGQMGKISESIEKMKSGIEDLVGKAITMLASGITATIGPALDALVAWVEDAMKELGALGDWFQKSGTASSAFQATLSVLATLFAPITKAVQELWTNIQTAFKQIQDFLQQHPAIWNAALTAVALVVANFVVELKVAFTLIGVVIQAVVFLVKQQFELFAAGLNALWQAAEFVWNSLKTGVKAVGDYYVWIFGLLPKPVQDAFKAVAQAVADWVRPILDFIGEMIGKIPGLAGYKATFDGLSTSLAAFGQKVIAGTAAQREANDATEEAAKKAKELADQQKSLGVMTADQAAAATLASVTLANTFNKLVDSHTQNIAQLTIAAKKAYSDLDSTRKSIEASGTAAQKSALDMQIKNIQAWATANHVALTDVKTAASAVAVVVSDITPAWAALDAELQKIGYTSEAVIVKAANDAALAWQKFTTSTSFNTAEQAQITQKTYTDLLKQIDTAQALGYTNEAARLDQQAAQVRTYADARGVILKEDATLWAAVAASIVPAVPNAILAVDTALVAMSDQANASFNQIIAMSQKVQFQTDAQIKDQLTSTTDAYNMMVNIAGTSAGEQLRITEAYYAQLKTDIEQNGQYYDDAERAKVQATLQAMMQVAQANHTTLETVKSEHTAATAQVSLLWTNMAQNMGRSIKQAASTMADTLVSGTGSFATACKTMLADIEKAFVKTFLQTAMDAVGQFVKNALTGQGGLLESLGKVVSGFLDMGKSATDAAKTATDAMKTTASAVSGGTQAAGSVGSAASSAGGGASAAIGSTLNSVMGITNMVTGAISAISGVISNFQLAGQTKVMENQQNLMIWIYQDIHGQILPALNLAIIPRMDDAQRFYQMIWDQLSGGFNDLRDKFDGLWVMLNDHLNRIEYNVLPAILAAIGGGGATSSGAAASMQPVIDAVTAGAASIVNACGTAAASVVDAVRGIGSLPVTLASGLPATGAASDLSPITTLLAQIQGALTQSSLRPNVTLNVEAAATAQDTANLIVRQLQLAGIMH